MEALARLGDEGIQRHARTNPVLAEVLEQTLREIEALLNASHRAYRLRALLTRDGEYLIRMEVAYQSREERDRLWDQAAAALERVRAGRDVHVLCGIYRLKPEG